MVNKVKNQNNFKHYKEMPLSLLRLAPWNYKKNDEKLQTKLMENIKKSGQVENILVRKMPNDTYEVVNGNHRFLALQSLGYENAVVYDLGVISDQAAKRIAVETNETKFDTDSIKLAELIDELRTEFEDLELTMPFSEEEMENFSNLLKFDWEDPNEVNNKVSDGDIVGSGPKSETLISVGSDKVKVIRLEVSPEMHDKFNTLFTKFRAKTDSPERAFEAMMTILSKVTDEEISLELKALMPKKSKKK